MDFILGILTGIGLAMYAGYYLEKRRKAKLQENYRHKVMLAYGINPELLSTYHNGKFYIGLTPEELRYVHSPLQPTELLTLLDKAIESENFEEAARLRDLINNHKS